MSYLVLIFLYQGYLNQFDKAQFEPDGFTTLVAQNTQSILRFFDYDVIITPHESEPSYRMFINNISLVRIVEGCNAISVMILFISFIVAFSGKWLNTILFVSLGILLIHILNVARIATLILGLLYYPEYEHLMHDILFPLIIYGVVFVLWALWINKFSLYAKKTN